MRPLVPACATCGRPLRLHFNDVLTCRACGVVKPHDLRRLLRATQGEATRAVVRAEK